MEASRVVTRAGEADRNFRTLLASGTLFSAAVQLTSVTTVLPYVCADLSAPSVVVALLVPLFTAGVLGGNIFASRVLGWGGSITALLFGVAVVQTLLVAINATAVAFMPEKVSFYPLLVTAGVLGLASGCSQIFVPLLISALLSPERRVALLLREAGFGAAIMTLVSAFSAGFLSSQPADLDDAELLGIGAAFMALSTLWFLALRPSGPLTVGESVPTREVFRRGFTYLRRQRWFRRFMLTQLLFTSVTLAPMFYAIYSSEALGADNNKLDNILIFVGLGLLAGIAVWGFIRRRFHTRGMYLCSALIAICAAVLCTLMQIFRLLPPVWIFGLTMLLVAVASQAVGPAAQDWIFSETAEEDRVVVVSYTQIIASVAAIVLGFIFGFVAGYGSAMWPLAIMLGVNVAALCAAMLVRMPRTAPATA